MSRIRVIYTPDGEAPPWVREAWVGCVIPLAEPIKDDASLVGVLGGTASSRNEGGYAVSQKEALDVLKLKDPHASAWFWSHIAIYDGARFVFGKQFCEYMP